MIETIHVFHDSNGNKNFYTPKLFITIEPAHRDIVEEKVRSEKKSWLTQRADD